MIVLLKDQNFKNCFNQILEEQEQLENLPIKIAFTSKAPGSDDDWGFFQVPHTAAEALKMCEVNIHVFFDGTKNAVDKLIFRDFLMAEEGKQLRAEYGRVKLDLMERLENNELSVSQYSRSKNEIVSQILLAAKEWKSGHIPVRKSNSILVLARGKCKKEESESYSEDSIKIRQRTSDGSATCREPEKGGSLSPKKSNSMSINGPKKRCLSYYESRSGRTSSDVLSEQLTWSLNNPNLISQQNLGEVDLSGEKQIISEHQTKCHNCRSSTEPRELFTSIILVKDTVKWEPFQSTTNGNLSIQLGKC